MSGYPHNNQPGYGYGGSPGQPYGAPQQPGAPYSPYGAQPPYGAPSAPHKPDKPPKDAYSQPPYYGSGSAPEKPPKDAYSQPPYYGGSAPEKPPKDGYSQPPYYGGPAPGKPDKPPKDDFSHSHYGGSAPPMAQPYGAVPPMAQPYGAAPPMAQPYGAPPPQPYGSPFAALVPSAFPPGTDPSVIACFQVADQDGSGLIDDKELQRALSSYNQSFSLRTVHLLMYLFTNTNSRKIGPKEFTSLFYSLQNWRAIFERHDRDRSGQIDPPELREALLSLGYAVSPTVLDLLVLKFDKSGGKNRAIEYDNFIECCLTVKGLADKFKAKDTNYTGSATFTYEEFMLTVLPFLVA